MIARLIEYARGFVRREPVMVRTAVGLAVAYAVTRFGLDPAVEKWAAAAILATVAAWARSKVSPV